MNFLIYVWCTLPHILLLCWWIDKYYTYAAKVRAEGEQHPMKAWFRSLPRKFVEFGQAMEQGFMWGGM